MWCQEWILKTGELDYLSIGLVLLLSPSPESPNKIITICPCSCVTIQCLYILCLHNIYCRYHEFKCKFWGLCFACCLLSQCALKWENFFLLPLSVSFHFIWIETKVTIPIIGLCFAHFRFIQFVYFVEIFQTNTNFVIQCCTTLRDYQQHKIVRVYVDLAYLSFEL